MFNPVSEFEQRSGPERPERKSPCGKCRAYITLKPPVEGECFACWIGWPSITRPSRNLMAHPHYAKVLDAMLARRMARLARKQAAEMSA